MHKTNYYRNNHHHPRAQHSFAVILLLGALLSVSCSWKTSPTLSDIESCARQEEFIPGLVKLDEKGHFQVGGQSFIPRGIGSYPLLEHAGNGRLSQVKEILQSATTMGRSIIRTVAFLDGSQNPATRIRDQDGNLRSDGLIALDRLLAAAQEEHARLILVLTNNWTDYGGAPAVMQMVAPGEALPKDAFWSDLRAIAAQKTYIRTLVQRTNTINGRPYATDSTIFAWELANEARCETAEFCQPDTLPHWAKVMAEAIRQAGGQQLIAWGGAGFLGEHGEDLERLAREETIDILTFHLYPFAENVLHFGTDGPSSRLNLAIRIGANGIRERVNICRKYRKPLLVEELGWKVSREELRDAERGLIFGAWLNVAREERVGTLPWMIGERGRPDYDGLLIQPDKDLATLEALRCE